MPLVSTMKKEPQWQKASNKSINLTIQFCPDPGFKPSFFQEIKKTGQVTSIEKYIWKFGWHKKMLLENVSSIPEVYSNMSYKLRENWNIVVGPYSMMDSVSK